MSPPDWIQRAVCRSVDPDLWYPDKGDSVGSRAAIAICRSCPVRAQCLAYALDHGERFGVWGGLSANQRRALTGHAPRNPWLKAAS